VQRITDKLFLEILTSVVNYFRGMAVVAVLFVATLVSLKNLTNSISVSVIFDIDPAIVFGLALIGFFILFLAVVLIFTLELNKIVFGNDALPGFKQISFYFVLFTVLLITIFSLILTLVLAKQLLPIGFLI
jgi:hypothetical protein